MKCNPYMGRRSRHDFLGIGVAPAAQPGTRISS
jgi:hypothetical protein